MKRLTVIGVLAVFAAACSNGATAAETVPPVITVAVAGTAPAITTTSTSPSTTSPSTTTTTLPETTTTVPVEDAIKQAVQDYFVAYIACGQAPSQCEPATFTASQGPSRSLATELAAGMARQGLYFSSDVQGSYLVAESVDPISDTEATAHYCAYDGLIVLGPDGPDGLATTVNDNIVSYRYQYRLFSEDGRWRVGEQHELERFSEGSPCPPAA